MQATSMAVNMVRIIVSLLLLRRPLRGSVVVPVGELGLGIGPISRAAAIAVGWSARAERSGSGPVSGKISEAGRRAISGRHLKSRQETPEAATKKEAAGGGRPAASRVNRRGGITGSGSSSRLQV